MTAKADARADKKAGIKPGSARDNALDKKRGVSTKDQAPDIMGVLHKMHKGALHADLHVPESKKIPEKKMHAAMRGEYGKETQRRARLAKILEHLKGK